MPTTEPTLNSPVLKERWSELVETGRKAHDLAQPLTPRQLWWRPSPKRWSVAECLEHLVLADTAYLEVIDQAVAEGRTEGLVAGEEPQRGWFARLLVDRVEPPARLKIPAPKRIRPERPEDPEASGARPLARFQALRDDYARRLEAADGLDLEAVKVGSPFVPLVRVSLDAALAIVTGHERRHLAQAGQVRRHPDFPVS